LDETPLVRDLLPEATDSGLKKALYELFGIERMLDKHIILLSSGELRKFQLTKTLHGLDLYNRRLVKDVIETFCRRKDKTMIMVTHYQEELPACITNFLFLKRN
jgi:molybdate transport system ATP-binding protein